MFLKWTTNYLYHVRQHKLYMAEGKAKTFYLEKGINVEKEEMQDTTETIYSNLF